jgi:perosamine synthetase
MMQHLASECMASPRGILCAYREAVYPPRTRSRTPGTRRYRCRAGHCARLIESERAQDRTIQIPLFGAKAEREIERVADALAELCPGCRSAG